VTEYYDLNLRDLLESKVTFCEKEAAEIMRKLLLAVHYIHINNITHRRICMENIAVLYDNTENFVTKLMNLQNSMPCEYDTVISHNDEFVDYYTAPEIINGKLTEKSDLWSCGVLLYELLSGKKPFFFDKTHEIRKELKLGKFYFDDSAWSEISGDAKVFITNLLN
jgi:calcium-dependent protein kinase